MEYATLKKNTNTTSKLGVALSLQESLYNILLLKKKKEEFSFSWFLAVRLLVMGWLVF